VCGIFGVVGGEPLEPARFGAIVDALAHRGPDGRGEVCGDGFALGHRRLSILDLTSAGAQPMRDPGGHVHLTYNGEIYNFRELRRELSDVGCQFRSQSDTEVLLAAYMRWGIDCVRRLNGMFAFGLYDARTGELFLARDRLGIKPIYYVEVGGSLVFCSELKGILRHPRFERRLDRQAVSCFLSCRHVLGDRTYFQGVRQLEPGCLLRWKGGRATVSRYWDVDLAGRRVGTGAAAAAEIREIIGDSVERQLVADVPVGLYLSGGLDSTILLYEAARRARRPVAAFTTRFDDPDFDESRYAALAAARFGAEHAIVSVSLDDYIIRVQELIRYRDQPLGMHNEVAMYVMARAAREKVAVVLCGEGADELFSGYGRIFRSPFDLVRRGAFGALPGAIGRRLARAAGLGAEPAGLDRSAWFFRRYTYFPTAEKEAIFRDTMRREADGDHPVLAHFDECFEAARARSFHDAIAYAFVKLHIPGLLLMVDATTMAAGIEGRVPFLDHRLVEASFRLPERMKLRFRSWRDAIAAVRKPVSEFSELHDVTKAVLRDAYRTELPAQILERRKMVFPVPLDAWLTREGGAWIRGELLGRGARASLVFEPARLARWLDVKMAAMDDPQLGRKLWLLLNLEYWLREYF
jgi:asparagine synthase (glutamine-hydrolysing)